MKDIELESRNRKPKPRYWTILIFLVYLFFEIVLDAVFFEISFDRETWRLRLLGFDIPLLIIISVFFGLIIMISLMVKVSRRKQANVMLVPPRRDVEASPYDFDPEDYKL